MDYPVSPDFIHGFDGNDDAGIYRISDDIAIVQTVDFITPVVNDPYIYGQIAAANSLSDIFAMGAKVLNALNVVAYDSCHISAEMLREILAGGISKVKEAGGVILGGHTVEDIEMKFGMSVTGIVHPKRFIKNCGIKEGDVIILTKPIGTGVLTTAIKADMCDEKDMLEAAFYMSQLNKLGSIAALDHRVNGMTDVTGFGLLGHLKEMLHDDLKIIIDSAKIPFMSGAYDMGSMGLFPSGSYSNRDFAKKYVTTSVEDSTKLMLMYDAQTSGGLLISVPENEGEKLLKRVRSEGYERAEIIGHVVLDDDSNGITVK